MPPLPYTLESLPPEDPRLVQRVPGIAELERLFAAPASVGRGALAVEGGVSLVAGPGMGKTTMLRQLAHRLGERRRIATAFVRLPSALRYHDASGFYPYLRAVVAAVRDALLGGAREDRLPTEAYAVLRRDLPGGDAPEGIPPPSFERWMQDLGAAASHGSGLCVLFDDVDDLAVAPWKQAFVSALRFAFQSCPGITPVYAVWTLFRDESLAGSNYFRNVTRPVFLAPIAQGGPRDALVRFGLPAARPEDVGRVSSLVGGHPRLVHRLLADVVESGWTPEAGRPIDGLLGREAVDDQLRFVRSLLASSPALGPALRQLRERWAREPAPYRSLAKGLASSGLVDESAEGLAFIPDRVVCSLPRP